MADRTGFKPVEKPDIETLNREIKKHRKKIFWRTIRIAIGVVMLVVLFMLWTALRTYDSFEIKERLGSSSEGASKYLDFNGSIVEYSNDGIVNMDYTGTLIWNQAFEMSSPAVDTCKDYLVAYDRGGTDIFIMKRDGLQKQIETSKPIKVVCIASQGTIAVLMEEDNNSYIKLYDQYGSELASGEFYGKQGGIPVDIALSYDAKKMAVDMIDISSGKVDSTISFYNFGSVGQNEIDNNVGSFSYESTFIPDIKYMANDKMIAIGDDKFIIYEGKQKPQEAKIVEFENEIASVFYNSKYFGVTYSNQDEESSHHLIAYDMSGKKVMENDTTVPYEDIEFLKNNEICVKNKYECELFTIHSVKKFSYTFDTEIYKIMHSSGSNNYIFIMDGETDEVRLR